MLSYFLISLHGTALVESLSPTRYSQNINTCDEGKEKEITCHAKPYAVVFYKANAVISIACAKHRAEYCFN